MTRTLQILFTINRFFHIRSNPLTMGQRSAPNADLQTQSMKQSRGVPCRAFGYFVLSHASVPLELGNKPRQSCDKQCRVDIHFQLRHHSMPNPHITQSNSITTNTCSHTRLSARSKVGHQPKCPCTTPVPVATLPAPSCQTAYLGADLVQYDAINAVFPAPVHFQCQCSHHQFRWVQEPVHATSAHGQV